MSRLLLAELARRAPLLPGKETVAFMDVDSQRFERIYRANFAAVTAYFARRSADRRPSLTSVARRRTP